MDGGEEEENRDMEKKLEELKEWMMARKKRVKTVIEGASTQR